MRSSMRQLQQRSLVLLAALACSAQAVMAQFPPLQPFQPLQPLQPFRPLAPLPPMKPLPGFAPFPQMEMPQFPSFAPQQPFAGAAAAGGRAGGFGMGPGTHSASSSSSSFSGPRASTTPGCTVVQETAGDSQGSSKAGSSSCSLSQRIEVCQSSKPGSRGHTRAIATINGQPSTCCVVLMKLPAKTPQLFCAAPGRATAYARLPAANTAVELKPDCSSSTADGTAGSLSCTVTFSKLPEGFTYPEGHTAASPLVMNRGAGSKAATASAPGRAGFVPCNNKGFKKFMQATSRTLPDGGVVLTSKCE